MSSGEIIKNTKQQRAPISDRTMLLLNVRSACRCQFAGCNEDLSQDILTKRSVNRAHIAHIVAATENGPRGNDPMPINERNDISNLMLVCMDHHSVIDNPNLVPEFPKALLQRFKEEHENRIAALTSIDADRETVVLRMFGSIRGNVVNISGKEVSKTVFDSEGRYPFYLQGKDHIEIDLGSLSENEDPNYWSSGMALIKDVLQTQIFPGIEKGRIKHLSVFALARISLLAYLGYELGDKVPTDFYQKQRDGLEGWCWQQTLQSASFSIVKLRSGLSKRKIALLVSLSGKIAEQQLPAEVDVNYTVYEIVPVDSQPERALIKTKTDLFNFRNVYQLLLRQIERENEGLAEMHLFIAAPAPVAIICGRELLRQISPAVTLYERSTNSYYPTFKINSNDTE